LQDDYVGIIPSALFLLLKLVSMNKIAGLFLMMICFTSAYCQIGLSFCASVEKNGYCNFNNVKFISSPDSTSARVFMEVRNVVAPIGATNLIFKIYRVDDAGQEKFQNMVQQPMQPDWYYAWTPYIFNSPGKFNVKVYNESDSLICTNGFELIAFK